MNMDTSGQTAGAAGTEVKPYWQSKTLIGLAVAAAGIFAQRHGMELAPQTLQGLTDAISSALALGGLIFAAIGRVTAKKPLS